MKRIIMAAMIASLAACGGDKDDVATDQRDDWEARLASLVYSFPDNGQQQVPVSAPVVLRFSSPVVVTNAALMDLVELRDDEGNLVEWDRIEEADSGQSLLLYPENNLDPLTDYQLSIAKIDLEKGDAEARNLSFSTRAAYEGPKSLVAEDEFRILRTIPNGEDYEVLEFTTFRVQFSQPLDRSTVIYGDGADATVRLAGPEGAVDAHVLVSGPYLTVDPKEDLKADTNYKLTFTTGLKSIYGDSMPGGGFGNPGGTIASELEVTAKATGPRGNMVQIIADTAGQKSPLTGKQINEVPMASVLLGEDTATQASGIVTAELAFVPDFPDATPLRVKRGSLIEGASIDVLIGGEVPAGFESGKVKMEFLSDATGYLLPNPYSDADDAPRQVRLWMDVAVSTETPSANGAITQDLLHIELVGTSIVMPNPDPTKIRMVINAVGVVEPNVLGSERSTGLLSFYMEEVANQDNPPQVVVDTTGPVLQSWMPGENADILKPGDPIILNFNKAIDSSSANGAVRLTLNESLVDIEYFIDGSSMVIFPKYIRERNEFGDKVTPVSSLTYSGYSDVATYTVMVSSLKDIHGGELQDQLNLEFQAPKFVEKDGIQASLVENTIQLPLVAARASSHAPLILASYPGYPCALMDEFLSDVGAGETDGYRKLDEGKAGICAGSFPGIQDGTPRDNKPVDDVIPVGELPSNRPIMISFSKGIDNTSVVLGKTFIVEKIDSDESVISFVKGELYVEEMLIKFVPYEGWEEGELYRYKLLSSGYEVGYLGSPSRNIRKLNYTPDYECGVDSICDREGLPLQTQLLAPVTVEKYNSDGSPTGGERDYKVLYAYTELKAGGPDYVQFFKGASQADTVLQVLSSQPVADTNHNFMHELSNIGTAPFALPGYNAGIYHFENEEYGPAEALLPGDYGVYPEYDPGGLKSPKNSAKILSRFRNAEWEQEYFDGARGTVSGLNFGCGYDASMEIPLECPSHKFSYLVSSVFAEVTNEVDNNGRIKVLMWPSIVIGTSLNLYAPTQILPIPNSPVFVVPGATGKQILRMRYSNSSVTGDRSAPIVGWISEKDNEAVMNVDLDLYVDIPFAPDWGLGAPVNPVNMRSYEIDMELEGNIDFLNDGRMVVEQYNTQPVDIQMLIYGAAGGNIGGYADLFIPEYGSRLNYVSSPIK